MLRFATFATFAGGPAHPGGRVPGREERTPADFHARPDADLRRRLPQPSRSPPPTALC